jgi:methylmalonyl-CoA mutase N-terminal domain/subunit
MRRDPAKYHETMERLRTAAKGKENLMPFVLEAIKAYATVGEICDVFREVYGIYHDPGFF